VLTHDEPTTVQEARRGVREWLAEAWDPGLTVREWWARLAESGWGCPGWPREWFGRGLGAVESAAVGEELAAAGVIGPPGGVGTSMGANVLFVYGSEE
jgi:alkylation response protein AidB-like acyl-CoA dehydrogenase